MPLEFCVTDDAIDEETHVVEPHGEIDLATISEVEERLGAVVDAGRRFVVVDLEQVGFLDSTCLRVLLRIRRRLAPLGGKLIVACPDPQLIATFEITGLTEILNVTPSRDDALAEARRSASAG